MHRTMNFSPPDARPALQGLKHVIANMRDVPTVYGAHYLEEVSTPAYDTAQASHNARVDYLGVRMTADDFAELSRFVLMSTALERGDPRPAFVQQVQQELFAQTVKIGF
jgi:hypothetical protein